MLLGSPITPRFRMPANLHAPGLNPTLAPHFRSGNPVKNAETAVNSPSSILPIRRQGIRSVSVCPPGSTAVRIVSINCSSRHAFTKLKSGSISWG